MVLECDLLVADKLFFDFALFYFGPEMFTASRTLHYLVLDQSNLRLNRGDIGLDFVYLESVLFRLLQDLDLPRLHIVHDLGKCSSVLRDLFESSFDHIFDEELPVAQLTDGAALWWSLFLTPIQVTDRVCPARFTCTELSCLLHAVLAIRHSAEVTMAAFEISCLFPLFLARVAPFWRVVVVTGIYGPFKSEDRL